MLLLLQVPFLSYLAIFVLTIATILLFFVPFRWLFMVWGVNKFTKRLRIPDYIEHNELLDFLSRVPSDRELVSLQNDMRDFRPSSFALVSSVNIASQKPTTAILVPRLAPHKTPTITRAAAASRRQAIVVETRIKMPLAKRKLETFLSPCLRQFVFLACTLK